MRQQIRSVAAFCFYIDFCPIRPLIPIPAAKLKVLPYPCGKTSSFARGKTQRKLKVLTPILPPAILEVLPVIFVELKLQILTRKLTMGKLKILPLAEPKAKLKIFPRPFRREFYPGQNPKTTAVYDAAYGASRAIVSRFRSGPKRLFRVGYSGIKLCFPGTAKCVNRAFDTKLQQH
jgi:hypothetical protein